MFGEQQWHSGGRHVRFNSSRESNNNMYEDWICFWFSLWKINLWSTLPTTKKPNFPKFQFDLEISEGQRVKFVRSTLLKQSQFICLFIELNWTYYLSLPTATYCPLSSNWDGSDILWPSSVNKLKQQITPGC